MSDIVFKIVSYFIRMQLRFFSVSFVCQKERIFILEWKKRKG